MSKTWNSCLSWRQKVKVMMTVHLGCGAKEVLSIHYELACIICTTHFASVDARRGHEQSVWETWTGSSTVQKGLTRDGHQTLSKERELLQCNRYNELNCWVGWFIYSFICCCAVTAAYVPDGFTWKEFDRELRSKKLVVAGSYGKLDGKVFRIGHMGIQADVTLVQKALDVMKQVIAQKK